MCGGMHKQQGRDWLCCVVMVTSVMGLQLVFELNCGPIAIATLAKATNSAKATANPSTGQKGLYTCF